MFNLRTGTPGAGKTLSLISELRHITDRPIYYHGIPELTLPWHLIDDPKNYHELIPDGSIFVLDEAQKIFPVRPPREPVPAAITFIETHRHRGIDIYFITQHPSLLDHHARRLVGNHVHLQRNFGMNFAARFENNKLFDYSNYHDLETCSRTQFKFPKDVFGLYKSAEVHTHKFKFPKKLLIIPVLLAMIGYGVYGVSKITSPSVPEIVPTYKRSDSQPLTFSQNTDNQTASPLIDWPYELTPKIIGIPYTAPFYRDLAKPVVMPIVSGCLASQTKCQCYTQQATKVDMPDDLCRLQAREKQFNPFLITEEQKKLALHTR